MKVTSADMNTRRLTGVGAVATLALAVLIFGCVFAATAGPREALYARTRVLQQTLRAIPPLARSVTVSSTYAQITNSASPVPLPRSGFTPGQLSNLTSQFHRDFSKGIVQLEPVRADWMGMTSAGENVSSTLAGTRGDQVQMEISYRLPLARYVRVLAGSLSAPVPRHSARFFPTINVAVTQQTAAKFGLRVGSVVQIPGPPQLTGGPQSAAPSQTGGAQAAAPSMITLRVAAIVAKRQPAASFWEADPSMAVPDLNVPVTSPPYWTSGAFALQDESAAVWEDFGPSSLNLQWVLLVDIGAVQGNQANLLNAALTKIVSEQVKLTGPLRALTNAVTVSTGMQQVLGSFLAEAAAVDALLWLLYVSLAVIAAIALLLAARMIVLRRAAEMTLRRARGATLRQIGLASARGAAIGSVPAAVVAGALAVLLVPGPPAPGGWWPGITVLIVAVGAPAFLGAWQQRTPRTARGRGASDYAQSGRTGASQPSLSYGGLDYGRRGRRRSRHANRLVVEVTAALAAIAGLVVFRQQGTQPGTAVNLYTSAAPVLVAIPVVIVVLRIYPLILRGLLREAARRRGATGFLGLAQATRGALTPAMPAFALVLAITLAAFAGMMRDAVPLGETNASWQAAGADVTISTVESGGTIPVSAQRALAAVPGVEHAAAVTEWTLTAPDDSYQTAIAVDPASYSALVASSPTWPAVDPRLLTNNGVLASARAIAAYGGDSDVVTLDFPAQIQVRFAGRLSSTPALPGGGPFVLLSQSLLAHEPDDMPNLVMLNGPRIDVRRLTALVTRLLPTATVTDRSTLLSELTSAGVQRGATPLFPLALTAAAGLGLAVMLLQLALGAADREATLARLATMGFGGRRRARLVILEVLPAVIAAAVAAIGSALLLPRIIAPAISLSVFTNSSANVPLAPNVASIALPIAALMVAAAVTLAIEISARRSVVSTLRGGE